MKLINNEEHHNLNSTNIFKEDKTEGCVVQIEVMWKAYNI